MSNEFNGYIYWKLPLPELAQLPEDKLVVHSFPQKNWGSCIVKNQSAGHPGSVVFPKQKYFECEGLTKKRNACEQQRIKYVKHIQSDALEHNFKCQDLLVDEKLPIKEEVSKFDSYIYRYGLQQMHEGEQQIIAKKGVGDREILKIKSDFASSISSVIGCRRVNPRSTEENKRQKDNLLPETKNKQFKSCTSVINCITEVPKFLQNIVKEEYFSENCVVKWLSFGLQDTEMLLFAKKVFLDLVARNLLISENPFGNKVDLLYSWNKQIESYNKSGCPKFLSNVKYSSNENIKISQQTQQGNNNKQQTFTNENNCHNIEEKTSSTIDKEQILIFKVRESHVNCATQTRSVLHLMKSIQTEDYRNNECNLKRDAACQTVEEKYCSATVTGRLSTAAKPSSTTELPETIPGFPISMFNHTPGTCPLLSIPPSFSPRFSSDIFSVQNVLPNFSSQGFLSATSFPCLFSHSNTPCIQTDNQTLCKICSPISGSHTPWYTTPLPTTPPPSTTPPLSTMPPPPPFTTPPLSTMPPPPPLTTPSPFTTSTTSPSSTTCPSSTMLPQFIIPSPPNIPPPPLSTISPPSIIPSPAITPPPSTILPPPPSTIPPPPQSTMPPSPQSTMPPSPQSTMPPLPPSTIPPPPPSTIPPPPQSTIPPPPQTTIPPPPQSTIPPPPQTIIPPPPQTTIPPPPPFTIPPPPPFTITSIPQKCNTPPNLICNKSSLSDGAKENLQTKDHPSIPLKSLYWTKITSDTSNSFWNNVKETTFDRNEAMQLFCRRNVNKKKDLMNTKMANETKQLKKKPTKLLTVKRSQAIAIFISTLNVDVEDIKKAVAELDTSTIDVECINAIFDLRPQSGELVAITEFVNKQQFDKYDEKRPLDKPEEFLLNLWEDPHFTDRLFCIKFMDQFRSDVDELLTRLSFIDEACKSLCGISVVRFLSVILSVGNFLNSGNRLRGDAHGFQLDILAKLRSVKSNFNNLNLLSYVIKIYLNSFDQPEDETRMSPLPPTVLIIRASQVDFAEIAKQCAKLRLNLKDCNQCVKVVQADSDNVQPFSDIMQEFLKNAFLNLKDVEGKLSSSRQSFQHTVNYFQPDVHKSNSLDPKSFFEYWISFCADVDELWAAQLRVRLNKKKQCAKESVDDMRSKSTTTTVVQKRSRARSLKSRLGTHIEAEQKQRSGDK